MGRHTRGTYAAIAALSAITIVGAGVPAQAITPDGPVRVGQLTLTHKSAGIAWLDGRVLHTPNGDTRVLPWTAKAAEQRSLRVLGHTARGWLVKDSTGDAWNVWLVRGQSRTKLSSTGITEGEIVSIVASTDHRRYAVADFDGDASALVSVHDLHGETVASRTFDGDGAVLDFSGPEAVVGTTGTQRWAIDPDTVTDLGVDAVAASIAHDRLLVRDPGSGQVGPTSLSSPATPSWTAAMDSPRLSPGGGRVASRTEPRGQLVEIRGIGTGAVLRSWQMRFLASRAPLWSGNHTIVFVGATTGLGDRERLASCTVSGRCVARSVVRPQGRLSLPPL